MHSKLCNLIRDAKRNKRPSLVAPPLRVEDEGDTGPALDRLCEREHGPPNGPPDPTDHAFLAHLPARDQSIAFLLMQGYTKPETAHRLGITRQSVYRAAKRIADKMLSAGAL